MDASPVVLSQERTRLVVRERHCRLELAELGASSTRLAAYLALVDRPLASLLARDRLRREAPGQFLYSSRPLRLLRFSIVPTLRVRGAWEGGALCLRSADCRITGLGRWEGAVDFDLSVGLRPTPEGLDALARVSLALPAMFPGWAPSLAGMALEQVLDRLERRLERGLRKDLLRWLS